jgi:1,4-dihydroxy-2-naphthoate octaprenyltransferase
VSVAFAIPVLVVLLKLTSVTLLLVALALPVAVVPVRIAYSTAAGPPLVRALKRMAITELAYALLLTLGLLL